MKKVIFYAIYPLLVFGAGFVCGTFWTATHSASPPSSHRPGGKSPVSVTIPDEVDEDRITKALEDPDFKRVHDFLNREYPAKLNIPTQQDETPPTRKETKKERSPVHFTLPETE